MKKSNFQTSPNSKLQQIFESDKQLLDELSDAKICNQIAFDLYQLRKSANLTQKQLAHLLGVKQSNISRWETPGYQGYKVKMLSKIIRKLGGNINIFITSTLTTSRVYKFEELIRVSPAKAFGSGTHSLYPNSWGNELIALDGRIKYDR